MGSQVSLGQKTDSPTDELGNEVSSVNKQCPIEYSTGATNTNAREHNPPDRLKILFRDHRGYRTLSEQKVTEWLAKNKQFYLAMPKDLVEIPEQIFSPLDSAETDRNRDRFHYNAPKSESSAQNGESSLHTIGSRDVGHHRSGHDKMNHFFQKTDRSRHNPGHAGHTSQKNELGNHRTIKISGKMHPETRKYIDRDTIRVERSTNGESLSLRFCNKDRDCLFGLTRGQKSGSLRRNSHSLAPKPSVARRRQSDGWMSSGNVMSVRKTLPSMLQNNASVIPIKNGLTPRLKSVRNVRQALALNQTGRMCIPKREKLTLNMGLVPISDRSQPQGIHDDGLRHANCQHQTQIWQNYSTMKRIKRLTTQWINRSDPKYLHSIAD